MKRQEINKRIGQRANLFLKDERDFTPEEEENSKKKWAELIEWGKSQSWYINRKRRNV